MAEKTEQLAREEFRAAVRKYRRPSTGLLETALWSLAEYAPLGGRLWPDPNPYMLRAYLSPRDPQFQKLWKVIQFYHPDLGQYDGQIFKGIPHLYLHHFFRGDDDEEAHNHPWQNSMSVILTGGYVEERWDPATKTLITRHLNPGDVNRLNRDDFHRVTLHDPARGCWTLFLSHDRIEAPRGYDWGFMDPKTEEFTPWGPWLDRKYPPKV